MRKAEYWLGQLIDSYVTAQRAGVAEDLLTKGREKHEEAHVLWEFWTAENSMASIIQIWPRCLNGVHRCFKRGVAFLNKATAEKAAPSKSSSRDQR